MEKLVKQLEISFTAFIEDANSQIIKGNKAAGTRARKASLEMEKMLKDFRKKSLEAAKG
jgi:Histone H1-like protein Hc1.